MSITLKEAFNGNTAANKVRNHDEAYIAVWNPCRQEIGLNNYALKEQIRQQQWDIHVQAVINISSNLTEKGQNLISLTDWLISWLLYINFYRSNYR